DSKGIIYIGGAFLKLAGNDNIEMVAQFKNGQWLPLGNVTFETNNYPQTMLTLNDTLYVGGYMKTLDGVTVNGLGKWDGSKWSSIDGGVAGGINKLIWYNGQLIAGGEFALSSNTSIKRLALFDGGKWRRICDNPDSSVYALSIKDDNLFFGGAFRRVGNTQANFIASCDLTTG